MRIPKTILAGLGVLALAGFQQAALADYVAYAVIGGQRVPLPERIDDIEAKYLVQVEWGRYSGKKSRVAVMKVQNRTASQTVVVSGPGYRYESVTSGGVPVDGIEAILTDALHRSGRFRLVERVKVQNLLKEQDFGASGRVAKPSAAKIGRVLGAQYIIEAVVTHYEPNYQGKSGGLGGIVGGAAGALLGGVKVKSSKSMVGMNFRLIDATTSEVVFTKQVSAVISESGISFGGLGIGGGGALGGFLSTYSRTPIGQAVIAAVNKGVYELVKQVGSSPPSGSVITVKGGKVYINLGQDAVQVGDMLTLYSKGEELIDPETGIPLGGDDQEIGKLRVIAVKKKFSIARPVGVSLKRIKRGDKVVSTRTPEPLQFAAAFTPPGKGKGLFRAGSGGGGSADEEAPAEEEEF
ncbi:MAG TPA: hypothetical protein ENK20_08275 [Chromatiales bacterium]|nr:hypothetical protein [Chromatiales bacterium]